MNVTLVARILPSRYMTARRACRVWVIIAGG